jgi:uncharacterized membrane protein
MESKARLLGHAVHPILIVFPLGLLATAVIFDVIHMIWGTATFGIVSYWMIVAGIIGGAIAAVFGFIDWSGVPAGTRAKSVGLMHGITNAIVLVLFILSWYLRSDRPETPTATASALSIIGFFLALVGGWLGGELVERLGIAVHEGANPDAPSSLQTDSARLRTPHAKGM